MSDCPECEGSGERTRRGVSVNPYTGIPSPDPQCDVSETCAWCHGTGTVDDAADAEEWRREHLHDDDYERRKYA